MNRQSRARRSPVLSLALVVSVAFACLTALAPAAAAADPVSPPTASLTIPAGTSAIEHKVVTPPAPRLDVLIAVDTTGSMLLSLGTARADAQDLIAQLAGVAPDSRFGLVRFRGHTDGADEYVVEQQLTTDLAAVRVAVDGLVPGPPGSGGDAAEGENLVFHNSYADPPLNPVVGTATPIAWRPDARKVLVVLADSAPHTSPMTATMLPACDLPDASPDPYGLDSATELLGMAAAGVELVMGNYSGYDLAACYQQLAGYATSGAAAMAGSVPDAAVDLLVTVHEIHFVVTSASPAPADAGWLTGNGATIGAFLAGDPQPVTLTFAVPAGTTAGPYTLDLDAIGDGNVIGRQTVTITVPPSNLPPVVDAGPDAVTPEGTVVTMAPTVADPDGDAFTLSWSQITGPAVTLTPGPGPTGTVTFIPPDGEATQTAYTFRLTATDEHGAKATDEVVIRADNMAPAPHAITGLPTGAVATGVAVTPWALFDEPGWYDAPTAVWTWGDGTTSDGTISGGSVSGVHTYTTPGSYLIQVTVTDKDGGTGTSTTQLPLVVETPATCTRIVEEPTSAHPEIATASCQLTVTNNTPGNLWLDVRVTTSSLSNNDKPVVYYNGSPTTKPPRADPARGIPDYSENLYVTDSVSHAQYDFGTVSCPKVKKPAHAACTSTATTANALSLDSQGSVVFTVTVHLNHGGHDGATISVSLDALVHAGSDVIGRLNTLFNVS